MTKEKSPDGRKWSGHEEPGDEHWDGKCPVCFQPCYCGLNPSAVRELVSEVEWFMDNPTDPADAYARLEAALKNLRGNG